MPSTPTAHGFQEYWGYLYHLDAMQGVSFPDINKTPLQQTVAPPCENTPIPGKAPRNSATARQPRPRLYFSGSRRTSTQRPRGSPGRYGRSHCRGIRSLRSWNNVTGGGVVPTPAERRRRTWRGGNSSSSVDGFVAVAGDPLALQIAVDKGAAEGRPGGNGSWNRLGMTLSGGCVIIGSKSPRP
jgi:hypothetical protein